MTPLDEWMGDLARLPGTRPLSAAELQTLRARGNRGDLELLRLGPAFSSEALPADALAGLVETRFLGPSLLLGPRAPTLDAATVQCSVLAGATVRASRIAHCVLGDDVVVEHHAVVEHSVLLPLRQRARGETLTHGVHVRNSHVTHCVVLGGSDLGPYCHARSHCVVGPFAHVGTGSELKAACLLGATPRNRIELPHRSYFGNASAKALHLGQGTLRFGSPPYLAALERGLFFLYGADQVSSTVDEGVPGAVQPRERLVLRRENEEETLEVEGVNLGALTTTSNFDPRHGGAKLATNMEAGARFGVLAIAQSPVHVAEGVLVASGAKITGADVPPDSLVLPGGAGGVLAGYLAETRERLGDGTAETVELGLGYLRQLAALTRVCSGLAGRAHGLTRLGPWRAAVALSHQLDELRTWLGRYLELVVRSAPLVGGEAESAGNAARRERLLARAAEQRSVAARAAEYTAELEALHAEARGLAEALERETSLERVLWEHSRCLGLAALQEGRRGRTLPTASATASAERVEALHARFVDGAARAEFPPLFGTSGIRGRFAARVEGLPTLAFSERGLVSPGLAYLVGRAIARRLGAHVAERAVFVARDPRDSGALLAERLCEGLADEGWQTVQLGIATTPAAAEAHELVVVVTASHNPPLDNGLKVFLGGIPLARRFEAELEAQVRALESLALGGVCAAPLWEARLDELPVPQAPAQHYVRLRETLASLDLAHRFAGHRLSLDLAHGAAACSTGSDGLTPSAPVALWLDEGVVVVGYGVIRDSARINERLGAAYAYGEGRAMVGGALRDVALGDGELACFAAGTHGHGVGRLTEPGGAHVAAGPAASRTILWPASLALPSELAAVAQRLRGGHRVFHDVDRPGHEETRAALDAALAQLPALPALAVDGDADRTLVTDEHVAQRPTPFVGGDELLRLCAAHAPGPVQRVVFTVESGLGLEKLFDARGLRYDVVTVGDRAVAECLLGRARTAEAGWLYGGEPSGHLLLCEVTASGALHLCDDPFAIHLHVLALCRRTGQGLGELLAALERGSLAPHTARKPDAWARDEASGREGISLAEKASLRLWSDERSLSPYAAALITDYVAHFGELYATLFHGAQAFAIAAVSPTLAELRCLDEPQPGASKVDVPIGELTLFLPELETAVEVLTATLQLTSLEYFGPDDVVLRFFSRDTAGSAVKVGELVARNSGTSPKNAAYHKLWPIHAPTGKLVSPHALARTVDELARRRAAFTDAFVTGTLRGPAGGPQ